MTQHCFKRQVCAVIVDEDGRIAVGENLISNNLIGECPREKGENYEKCITICRQDGHAESMAIENALQRNMKLKGANIYLMGHNRVCLDCKKGCDLHGLNIIIVNKEGK